MVLFGRALTRVPIILLAALCTGLSEEFDGFEMTMSEGLPRVLLYFSAFVTSGLFVREVHRNRLQSTLYIEKIEEQRDALSEAEGQLEALIESSPAAIVTTDSGGVILMANEAAHRLFGSSSELKGRPIEGFIPSLANVSEGRSSHPRFRAVMQCQGFREDRDVFLADICFSTYPTASGLRLTAMIIDTSEELRQHEEGNLQQLMAGSRLAAGAMSHEIRNVCAAIAVVHQNLLRSGLISGNEDFEALGGLVKTLEDISAIELSYTAPQLAPTDVLAAVNDLRIVITPTLQEQGIEAAWECGEEMPKAWADRSQLIQIFLNLTRNSIRALSNAESPRLQVIARATEGMIFVEFIDNAGGVKDVQGLFQPFQQGAAANGLGLYLSRAFARSMGGDLKYRPAPGIACFVLELRSVEREVRS
jgi:PAS domain S-box-containing protein